MTEMVRQKSASLADKTKKYEEWKKFEYQERYMCINLTGHYIDVVH